MAPKIGNNENLNNNHNDKQLTSKPYDQKILWDRTIAFMFGHIGAFYGQYLIFTSARIWTTLFAISLYIAGCCGLTAGAHRLWCHHAYKATWQLKWILMICQTIASQHPIFIWVRFHRIHHKYTDERPDPHNSSRGLFYSHFGWILLTKLPETIHEGKLVHLEDMYADPVVQFQYKYYNYLVTTLCYILPTAIPWLCWNESLVNGFFVAAIWKYIFSIHSMSLINSAAHKFGTRPYDKEKKPTENLLVSLLASGEGWHNYHHTFPWDYRAAELGGGRINLSTTLIDLFAKIGWAYDLKTVSDADIQRHVMKSGDGTHPNRDRWTDYTDPTLGNIQKADFIKNKKLVKTM